MRQTSLSSPAQGGIYHILPTMFSLCVALRSHVRHLTHTTTLDNTSHHFRYTSFVYEQYTNMERTRRIRLFVVVVTLSGVAMILFVQVSPSLSLFLRLDLRVYISLSQLSQSVLSGAFDALKSRPLSPFLILSHPTVALA